MLDSYIDVEKRMLRKININSLYFLYVTHVSYPRIVIPMSFPTCMLLATPLRESRFASALRPVCTSVLVSITTRSTSLVGTYNPSSIAVGGSEVD